MSSGGSRGEEDVVEVVVVEVVITITTAEREQGLSPHRVPRRLTASAAGVVVDGVDRLHRHLPMQLVAVTSHYQTHSTPYDNTRHFGHRYA